MENKNIKKFLNSYSAIGSPNLKMRKSMPFKLENKYETGEEVLEDLIGKIKKGKIKIKSEENMKKLCTALYKNDMKIIYFLLILCLIFLHYFY